MRKIGSLGLLRTYRSSLDFKAFCGMISALNFLPEADVRLGQENFKELVDEMPLRDVQQLEYFELCTLGLMGQALGFHLPHRMCTSTPFRESTERTNSVRAGTTSFSDLLATHILRSGIALLLSRMTNWPLGASSSNTNWAKK